MCRNSTFQRNYSHDNDRHGINLVTSSSEVLITSNRSIHNGATGLMAQNGTHDVTIQSNEFTNNGLQGIYLRDADGCTVSGNTLHDNGQSGLLMRLVDHATVSGNSFSENDPGTVGRAVVRLDSATVNVLSSNNIASSRARQGVLETGTSDFNVVRNNVLAVPSQPIVLIGPNSTQSGNEIH